MTESLSGLTSGSLVGPAATVMRASGYETNAITLHSGATMLLAEDDYFAVGIVEFGSSTDLPATEASAAAALAERIAGSPGTPKQWDAYLALLSHSPRSPDSMPEAITNIVYNTRFLRRIVRWGCRPDTTSITSALRPFLPLTAALAGSVASPVDLMVNRLPSYGVPVESAALAIAQWERSRG